MKFHSQIIASMLFVLLAIGLIGCSQNPIKQSFVAKVNIPIKNFIDIKSDLNGPVRVGQSININISNKTNDCVAFPLDYGLRIFVFQNKNWMQIPYKGRYISGNGSDIIVMDPLGGLFSTEYLSVDPDYSNLQPISTQQRIRIVIVGRLCINGIASQQAVADYVDLNIQP